MAKFSDRLRHAWNAFNGRDHPPNDYGTVGYGLRPDRVRMRMGNERTIVTSVYNRIAMDVAAMDIRHVRTDEDGFYLETIRSGLNECLSVEANKDQSGRSFIQDVVISMCDEGCVAVVPVDTNLNPKNSTSYDIRSMRSGKILEWRPDYVKIRLYNDRTGRREEIWMPKSAVAIIENPLFSVMNEPNSTMQRLIHKLNLLDSVDEAANSDKMNLIIQLPYTVRTEVQKQRAEERRKAIEMQLTGSRYGIAYADATEKITQLGHPIENNLLSQIEYLTKMLYGQLGITEEIFSGSADEKQMLNYYSRTIEPFVEAITCELRRKFLTKTARTQGQDIMYFRNPFKLVGLSELATSAESLIKMRVITTNEFRGSALGMKPSEDPGADSLSNPNIDVMNPEGPPMEQAPYEEEPVYEDEQLEQSDKTGMTVGDIIIPNDL